MADAATDCFDSRSNIPPHGQAARHGNLRPHRRARQPHRCGRSAGHLAALGGPRARRARSRARRAAPQPHHAAHRTHRRGARILRALQARPKRGGRSGGGALRAAGGAEGPAARHCAGDARATARGAGGERVSRSARGAAARARAPRPGGRSAGGRRGRRGAHRPAAGLLARRRAGRPHAARTLREPGVPEARRYAQVARRPRAPSLRELHRPRASAGSKARPRQQPDRCRARRVPRRRRHGRVPLLPGAGPARRRQAQAGARRPGAPGTSDPGRLSARSPAVDEPARLRRLDGTAATPPPGAGATRPRHEVSCGRMAFETWLAFAAASAVLLVIPGPTILTVISYSVAHGGRANAPLVAAVALGDSTALVLSLIGLGALLAASALAFTFVKLAGGLYLIYLGIKLLRSGVSPADLGAAQA